MVHIATALNGEQNSSKSKLLLNTSDCKANFKMGDFVTAADETNRLGQSRKRPGFPTTASKATITQTELFESSNVDDDRFLAALEHQGSYDKPTMVTDLDQSIEAVLKYFDEDVAVGSSSGSNNVTPAKSITRTGSKVASAVANFRTKAVNFTAASLGRKKKQKPDATPKVKELKQKYEPTLSPKKKSKVKQIAQMFNSKITQIMRHDKDGGLSIKKDVSPDAKPKTVLSKPVPKPRTKFSTFYVGLPSPVFRPRNKSSRNSSSHTCLVAEDVFRQLSVKDKALLYNKFIDDMSKKNPEFGKHAEVMKAKVRHQIACGEVVTEKQEPVAHLARELEAKCRLPKRTFFSRGFQRAKSFREPKRRAPARPSHMHPAKAKEAEDILVPVQNDTVTTEEHDDDSQEIGALTVVVLTSPDAKKQLRPKPHSRQRKHRDNRFLHEMCIFEPSLKRSLEILRSPKGKETYAPPAKIRRQRSEHLEPQVVLDNQPMERLFYMWIKETNGVSFDITATGNEFETIQIASDQEQETLTSSLDDNAHQNSAVDWLLKKALENLETAKVTDNTTKQIETVGIKENAVVDTTKESIAVALEKANTESLQQSVIEIELPMQIVVPAEEIQVQTPIELPMQIVMPAEKNHVQKPNELHMQIMVPAPEVKLQTPIKTPRKIKYPAPPIPAPRISLSIESSVASTLAKPSETDDSESGLSNTPASAARTTVTSETSTTSTPVRRSDTEESESGLSNIHKPPENELQKSHDHNPAALSEHQLRVQASLQRLNIPDWYRQYNQQTSRSPDGAYKPGNFTRKRTTESGRWAGLNSKTTSLSSLGSQRSDRSPLLLSPSAHSHHGGGGPNAAAAAGAVGTHQHHGGAGGGTGAYGTGGPGSFSRWSTSHLNSSQTSPSVSQRGSFSRGGPVNSSFMSVASGNSAVIRNSFRQPYLGWRSTEKLSQRTPHERLASSLLAQQQRTSPTQCTANGGVGVVGTKLQAVTPEIQTSIKEVTSAIVHYVNDQTQQQRSRSTSPNSRKCWLESSFVGTRPLDSPQTPVIESSTNTFSSAAASSSNNNNNSISSAYLNSSANSSIHSHILTQAGGVIVAGGSATTNAAEVLRMNGLSCVGGAPDRSLSNASLEDVLASLLGLPSTSSAGTGAGASAGDAYARSTTDGASASETLVSYRQQQQQQSQQHMPQQQKQQQQQQLLVNTTQAEQQRLRRRSEGDAPAKQQKEQQQQQQQQQQKPLPQQQQQHQQQNAANSTPTNSTTTTTTRRVSLDDSTESATIVASSASTLKQQPNSVATPPSTAGELPIKCRNTKCDRSATAADAKKHYKSCHNCTHLYCTRECRRAHWEKHRKACLHARASNLCRQVLSTCKDDLDSQRHLSVLARKGYLSQGRGVVRVLFRSAESAEGFIKHGFQCMGEASYVRWPDLMPAEMGLELYSELLKLSTEYKPDSKMMIYVAICVVSEAPGMGQAPVRWERQLVSRCAKLKLCKTVLGELDQQQAQVMPLAVVAVPETTTEVLILTFNPLRPPAAQRELILSNILDILSRRGVLLRKHYPEIYQRLQSYSEGQTDKFNPVTMHPRDSHSGLGFVCIIMPVHSESEIFRLPSAADGGNRVTTIDVGSPAALAQFDDDELLTRSTS